MEELSQDLMIGVYHVLEFKELASVFLMFRDGRTARCYMLENGMMVVSYEDLKYQTIVVAIVTGKQIGRAHV